MKVKGIIAVLSLLLTGSVSVATGQQRTEQMEQRLQQMKDRLKLTPDQIEQVRPIFAEEMQQLKTIRDKYAGDQGRRTRMKMGREMRGVVNAADEKLKKILSKDQMNELKKLREERREQMRERRGR